MQIDNVAAIVTNGVSGLGAATAEMLAARVTKVTILDMNEKPGTEPQTLELLFEKRLWSGRGRVDDRPGAGSA